jgi:hypothetical protein
MKATSLFLTVSLAANAALVGVILLPTPGGDSSATSAAGPRPPSANGAPAISTAIGQNLAALWQSDNPAALRDALRAAGLPEDLVRQIVNNKVWSRYNARMKELTAARSGRTAYWRGSSAPGLSAEQSAELRELSRAARKQMSGLFGGAAEAGGAGEAISSYDFLPPAKAAQLRDIERDYSELRAQVLQDAQGFRTAADLEKLRYLDEEKNRDLAELLTPEERQAYELRNSATAQRLRTQLAQFDATEAEYQAIYGLQKAFDQKYNPDDGTGSSPRIYDQEAMRQRRDAEKQLQADLASTLGEQRYADYVRAQDQDYRTLQAAAARYNLPPAAVDQVYATRDTALAASQRIADDTSMTPDQRRQAIADLAAPVRSQIVEALGPDVASAYLANTGNRWLDPLSRGSAVAVLPGGGLNIRSFASPTRSPSSASTSGGNMTSGSSMMISNSTISSPQSAPASSTSSSSMMISNSTNSSPTPATAAGGSTSGSSMMILNSTISTSPPAPAAAAPNP